MVALTYISAQLERLFWTHWPGSYVSVIFRLFNVLYQVTKQGIESFDRGARGFT